MIKKALLPVFILLSLILSTYAPTYAASILGNTCSAGGDTSSSSVCTDISSNPNENPVSGNDSLILKIANIISYVAGIAAVIVLVVGGIQFAVSGGDSSKVSSARTTILGAVIGIVIIVLGRAMINFLISRL
jgi:hypothetical protein